ncbi:hypothetical protein GCM10010466_65480 [Planomonospora alba]|uniref:Uncharacterized protein n=1 Tax=Planomonospora alba TaxID=161354 RepID=A0ABP6P327_9ACTN
MSAITTGLLLLSQEEPDVPLSAVLVYDPVVDPYALRLVFRHDDGREMADYLFARDLLAAGLTEPTGTGDVRIAPAGEDWVMLTLVYDGDAFSLFTPRDQVVSALARCYRQVPRGHEDEWLDWDTEIHVLLTSRCHRQVRLWEAGGWCARTATLTLTDDPVVAALMVPDLRGERAGIWYLELETLRTWVADSADGWIRLELPRDGELLLQSDQLAAFLADAQAQAGGAA